MKITLETKPVHHLSLYELKRCRKLTFMQDDQHHGRGEMYAELHRQLKKGSKTTARAILMRRGKSIIAWALIWQPIPARAIKQWHYYMYVQREYRRKGCGTMLLNRARVGRTGEIHVFPHDGLSRCMYEGKMDGKRIVNAW